MRGYCLLSTKEDVTYYGDGPDAYETLFKGIQYRMDTKKVVRSGLTEFFSPEEAKQIFTASQLPGQTFTRLCGTSVYVPMSRLYFLPLFALALGVSFAFAIPMFAKSVSVFGFEIASGQVIFPLVFVFTDLINELFGYRVAKSCIQFLSFSLVIIAILIQLALFLEVGDTISATLFSDASSDDIIRGFDAIYTGLPQTLLINAGCLLVADTFNAYLFAQLKRWMQGAQLWLRSLCSSCFASITYSVVFTILFQLCCWQLPGPETISISHLLASITFKLPYFIAMIPLIYAIRYYIFNQELKLLRAEMRAA